MQSRQPSLEQKLINRLLQEEASDTEEKKDSPLSSDSDKEVEGDGWFTLKTTPQLKLEEEFYELDDRLYSLEIRLEPIRRALAHLICGEKLDDIYLTEGLSGRYERYAAVFTKEWAEERIKNRGSRNFILKKLDELEEAIYAIKVNLFHKKKDYVFPEEWHTKLENYCQLVSKRIPPLRQVVSEIIEHPASPKNTPDISEQNPGLFKPSKRKAVDAGEDANPGPAKKMTVSGPTPG